MANSKKIKHEVTEYATVTTQVGETVPVIGEVIEIVQEPVLEESAPEFTESIIESAVETTVFIPEIPAQIEEPIIETYTISEVGYSTKNEFVSLPKRNKCRS